MRRKGIPFSATKTKDGETADEASCKAVWDASTFDHSVTIKVTIPGENISENISLEAVKVDTNDVNCGTLSVRTSPHKVESSGQVVKEVVTKVGAVETLSLEFLTQGGGKAVYTPRKPRQFTLPHTEIINTGLFA